MTIGEKITPVLVEIEDTLWEFEANIGDKPDYPEDGFRAALKISMSVILDKMWELQEKENIPMEERERMAEKAGEDFRQFIKTYTNIDTVELYKKLFNDGM